MSVLYRRICDANIKALVSGNDVYKHFYTLKTRKICYNWRRTDQQGQVSHVYHRPGSFRAVAVVLFPRFAFVCNRRCLVSSPLICRGDRPARSKQQPHTADSALAPAWPASPPPPLATWKAHFARHHFMPLSPSLQERGRGGEVKGNGGEERGGSP